MSRLGRFGIRSLLAIIALVAVIIWFTDSGFRKIADFQSAQLGRVGVFAKSDRERGETQMRVQYIPHPQLGTKEHISKKFTLSSIRPSDLSFEVVEDPQTGLWCICDKQGQGLVILIASDGKYWHPGIHVGWLRGLWADRYRSLKSNYASLPYDELPGEQLWVE